MTDCAICGATLDPAVDDVEIQVTWNGRDIEEVNDYYMHEWCAAAVLGGWREP